MTPIDIEVAKNMRYYRKKRGMSQAELADKLGLKRTTVSGWEVCRNAIDIDALTKICQALDVSIKDMFGSFGSSLDQFYTEKERVLICAYRLHPEIQHAVDLLLGLSDTSED